MKSSLLILLSSIVWIATSYVYTENERIDVLNFKNFTMTHKFDFVSYMRTNARIQVHPPLKVESLQSKFPLYQPR